MFDLTGRDFGAVRGLWREVSENGGFDLNGTAHIGGLAPFGFRSGSSTHADRLRTIAKVYRDTGAMVDPHTADGIKVGLEQREAGVPLICLETALPAKFAATIHEALGRDVPMPAGFEALEKLPQRVEVMDPDVAAVKSYITIHCKD